MTAATLNGTGNGTERHAAAARYCESVAAGVPLTGKDLADEFGKGERWGRQVIADTREVEVAAAPSAAAPTAERHGWLDQAVRLVVALVAAAASYGHMHHVALLAGEPPWIAQAWPITVDGLVIAALRSGDEGRPWLLLAMGVSIASNVLAQAPEHVAAIAPAIFAWPTVALYGTHRLRHRRAG